MVYEKDTLVRLTSIADTPCTYAFENTTETDFAHKCFATYKTTENVRTTFTDAVYAELLEYFDGKRRTFTFSYSLRGTPFQHKVWEALCRIPYGQTKSYKDIAIYIGQPQAARAVGMANNKNPLAIVVPCHRVIGSKGNLVGYAGGLSIKAYLLALEKREQYA